MFVHGCYWHGHACKIGHVPRSNTPYWSAKIARNIERDLQNASRLESAAWEVVVIRECTLDHDTANLINRLREKRTNRDSDIRED